MKVEDSMTEQDRKFWENQLTDRSDAYVINGNHYRVGEENVKQNMKGMGGSKFKIKVKATGEVIETTNLWHQGIVPAEMAGILPNDADFVKQIKVQYIET